MARTRPPDKVKLSKRNKKMMQARRKEETSPEQLLAQAAAAMSQGDMDSALHDAAKALKRLRAKVAQDDAVIILPALNLLGEINVELGDIPTASAYFREAAEIDPDGQAPEERGGGAEKFLWLAQLSEEGGLDSVRWFQKGADVLRRQIASQNLGHEDELAKRAELARALCGIAEIYMTDLSWDDSEAETQCNKVMEEALELAPDDPDTLQTLASVRISQLKKDEAKQFLSKSLNLWKDLPPEDPRVPAFATRISLARLLMEAGMEEDALEVTQRLVSEDDQSVEAWYLGGFCQHLIAEREQKGGQENGQRSEHVEICLRRSRQWLRKCIQLYRLLEYEDERLLEHAVELVQDIDGVIPPLEGEEEVLEDDGSWEDVEENGADEDDEMEVT